MCIDFSLFAAIIAELFLGFFLGFLGVFLMEPCEDTRSEYENYLWQVLLRGESLPPKDSLTKNLFPDSSEKSIRLIHALLNAIPEINNLKNKQGSESKKQYFNALDPKTKKAIWSILELARHEHDNLNFRRPPENRWLLLLDARPPLERADAIDSIDKKSQLLQPLLDLSKAIQPTSLYERFLKTTADLMAHVSDQDRQSLDWALSDCVRSMTRR
jgi:hypothetical protein